MYKKVLLLVNEPKEKNDNLWNNEIRRYKMNIIVIFCISGIKVKEHVN